MATKLILYSGDKPIHQWNIDEQTDVSTTLMPKMGLDNKVKITFEGNMSDESLHSFLSIINGRSNEE